MKRKRTSATPRIGLGPAAGVPPGGRRQSRFGGVTFFFDPISPFAYLAFEQLPQALEGCSYAVRYRPLLFAALLEHWQHKGPAEIEPKRAWTFRHVAWLAQQQGIAMQAPAVHPFNPLPLLRLAIATGPNRRVVEAVMRHVWRGGGDATDPARLAALTRELAPARDPSSAEVKDALRAATDEAIAAGLFGVPTFELDGRLFWGLDALPMLRAALQGDAWFDGAAWDEAGRARPGVRRR
jgi:2-hydroxychromene-2-carboxylate isomerase